MVRTVGTEPGAPVTIQARHVQCRRLEAATGSTVDRSFQRFGRHVMDVATLHVERQRTARDLSA